jgi:ABC-2 type transport system permease protein
VIARFNPLTYLVDALRGLMVPGATAFVDWGTDFMVLSANFGLLMAVAIRLYPGLVR